MVQLNHAGRYSHSFMMNGKMPVAPSAIPSRMTRETPEALDLDGIKQTIVDFAESAERVKKCGYDAVEVLSGTGYLISEFLSPVTNIREDEYGGSFENRIRFGVEIMKAIREKVGPDYPVMVRLDNNDFMEGGQRADELTEYARILAEECGVDALCVKGNWHEARVPQMTANVPRGTYAYLAKKRQRRGGRAGHRQPSHPFSRSGPPNYPGRILRHGRHGPQPHRRSLHAGKSPHRPGKRNRPMHRLLPGLL